MASPQPGSPSSIGPPPPGSPNMGPPPGPMAPPGVDVNNLPNRQLELFVTITVLTVLSAAFVIWRLVVVYRTKRRFHLSDYFMMVALGLEITANVSSIVSTYYGQGYHIYDPIITTQGLVTCLRLIFIAQFTNVLSMFFLKASISSYLLALNFSPVYRTIILISIGIILLCNLTFPMIDIFGACTPLSYRWNKMQEGHCWPLVVDSISGYQQSVTNIVTDIIYSASPLVFLAQVQLARSTQWGLRAVFLVCLVGTAVSVCKLTQLHVLAQSTDSTWDAASLSIASNAEVGVGMIAACLPPLRSFFTSLLRRAFPGSHASYNRSRGHPMSGRSMEMQGRQKSKSEQTQLDDDHSSERSILAQQHLSDEKGITKTVNVDIQGERVVPPPDYNNHYYSSTSVHGRAHELESPQSSRDFSIPDTKFQYGRTSTSGYPVSYRGA